MCLQSFPSKGILIRSNLWDSVRFSGGSSWLFCLNMATIMSIPEETAGSLYTGIPVVWKGSYWSVCLSFQGNCPVFPTHRLFLPFCKLLEVASFSGLILGFDFAPLCQWDKSIFAYVTVFFFSIVDYDSILWIYDSYVVIHCITICGSCVVSYTLFCDAVENMNEYSLGFCFYFETWFCCLCEK